MTLKSGTTRAQDNRRIRQDALREQLAKQKHVEHVIDLRKKADDSDLELDSLRIQRIKLSIDTRLALIKKYLPDLKQIEVTGEDGQAIKINASVIAAEMTQEQATRLYQELIK